MKGKKFGEGRQGQMFEEEDLEQASHGLGQSKTDLLSLRMIFVFPPALQLQSSTVLWQHHCQSLILAVLFQLSLTLPSHFVEAL